MGAFRDSCQRCARHEGTSSAPWASSPYRRSLGPLRPSNIAEGEREFGALIDLTKIFVSLERPHRDLLRRLPSRLRIGHLYRVNPEQWHATIHPGDYVVTVCSGPKRRSLGRVQLQVQLSPLLARAAPHSMRSALLWSRARATRRAASASSVWRLCSRRWADSSER
jgi:hypothetical protein